MIYLLHLDDYHLDDLLFVQSLGRLLRGARLPVVLVHGSGGGAEQMLEARGLFPEKEGGRYVNLSNQEQALVEAGYRQTNRMLVSKLTDEGISAVGFQSGDRGLIRLEQGRAQPGAVGWLVDLLAVGVVPVVSTLFARQDGVAPLAAADVLTALAAGLAPRAVTPVALTRTTRPGVGTPPAETLPAEALADYETDLADAPTARAIVASGGALLVTALPALVAPSGASGTRIG